MQNIDLDYYKKQTHKIKMVSDLLEIRRIDEILKNGCDLLELKEPKSIEKFSLELDHFFQKIIAELEIQLKQIHQKNTL